MAIITLKSNNTDATHRIGRELGSVLPAGTFVALQGLLGAGKTQLVKGIAWGLGIVPWEGLRSPTFVLLRSYDGGAGHVARCPLHHIDFYRLADAPELPGEIDEAMHDPAAISVAEWAEVWRETWPERVVEVKMSTLSESSRQIEIDDNGLFDSSKLETQDSK